MTPEVAPSAVVDFPEEWFERSQRAFSDIRYRLERRQRELDLREQELEARARDLVARGEKLRDAFRAAEEASQDLMARTHRLREEERALAAARDAAATAQRDVAAKEAEVAQREARLGKAERSVKEREEAVARSRVEVDRAREHMSALQAMRETLSARLRELGEGLEGASTPGFGAKDAVVQLLALKAEFEATLDLLRSREGEAETLFAKAAARSAEVDRFARAVREQEGRLEEARSEIVNARHALLAVDGALAHLPYEVVDDFTKSAEFDDYERALRALKRFETAGGRP